MKISDITVAAMLALCTSTAFAQTYTKAQQQAWMEKAGLCKPVLDTTVCHPVAVVDIVKDDKAFQGYKAVARPGIDDLYTKSFKQMKSVTLDFGRHMVGNVSFKIKDIGPMQDAVLRFGPLTIDNLGHTVLVEDTRVELTLKEYDVLNLLCRNPGRVFSRDELLNNVWGVDYDGESRTVDMHIKTLRQKLGPAAGPMIKTVRGIGYKIEDL